MILKLPLIILIVCLNKVSNAITCQAPEQNTIAIQSNNFVEVLDSNMNYIKQSLVVSTHDIWINIPDAAWIWTGLNLDRGDAFFRVQFNISSVPINAILEVAADDSVRVYLNKVLQQGCNWANYHTKSICNVQSNFNLGINSLVFIVTNYEGNGGLIFKLSITT